ncbi:ABC transporter substrate-binding protein, partial [Caldivirga sp.]|uniref:ABC transporter substrate-binding protein n=1 Tax=Caldivirga sp. TaxID=2080243 RepID=UPI0025BD762C
MNAKSYILLAVAVVMIMLTVYSVDVAYAQYSISPITYEGKYEWVVAAQTPIIYAPGTPIFNPYAPSNVIGKLKPYSPLAYYNPLTGQFYPVLARNWTVQILPNGSGILTVYLRPGFYWFNGSAILGEFTAWDVYAEFYIGMKAFGWYVPYINQSLADEDIRIINNYTIQFLFQRWSPWIPTWVLSTWMDVPYAVWKPIVNALKPMNWTQAMAFGSNNITKFVVPYWGLGPYYMTYISSTAGKFKLDPMYFNGIPLLAKWYEIYPLASWEYYAPIIEIDWLGGNAQDMTAFLANKANAGAVGLSMQQQEILNKSGILDALIPVYWWDAVVINPYHYPFNMRQVRLALCYAVNTTEVAASWGIPSYVPNDYIVSVPVESVSTFPPELQKYIELGKCTYNLTKATEILESLGFKKINGYWYTPNGTKLTLEFVSGSGFTDMNTMAMNIAEQLKAFGIDVTFIGQEVSTWVSVTISEGEFEAAPTWPMIGTYLSMPLYMGGIWWWWTVLFPSPKGMSTPYPFQWPNGTCSPVYMPSLQTPYGVSLRIPNGTIVSCVNSTLGYINFTNWWTAFQTAYPGTSDYNELIKTFFAWEIYFVPAIPYTSRNLFVQYAYYMFDPNYIYKCLPPLATETLIYPIVVMGPNWGWNSMSVFSTYFGAFVPKGEIPPLAEAIANGSLWTNPRLQEIATFLGIPPSPSIQQCVASYFHIPYTPVT